MTIIYSILAFMLMGCIFIVFHEMKYNFIQCALFSVLFIPVVILIMVSILCTKLILSLGGTNAKEVTERALLAEHRFKDE